MDHPRPWLRYLDAKDLDDKAQLAGMAVTGSDGEQLGKIDGFIIDESTARPYHVVVDAGGWFTHKRFLLPVGHVGVEGDRLVADIGKDRVKRFPGFDKDEFEKLSTDDVNRMNAQLATACCAEGVTIIETAWDTGDHYRSPEWWQESYYQPTVGGRR